MQDGQMMQTPAAKRQDVEGAQQQQQQLVTAARAISAEATAAKKSRSDPLPSGKKARCRPSKDTMEGWGDIICSSTTKKPVGNAEDPMFKAPFLRKEWLNIVEKAQNSAEWDAALAKGWIKPADMGGKKHDKQCEVCSSLCPCSAPALALLPALLALPDSLAPRCWSRPSALRAPIAPTSSSSTRARSLPTPCRNGLMSLRPRRIWSTRALRAPRGPLWSRTSSSTSGERTTRRRSKIFTQS